MNRKRGNGILSFIIIILLLLALSVIGIIAPESVQRLQDSNTLKWPVAILCGLVFSYILTWLSTANTSPRHLEPKSKSHLIRDIMITDLRRVLYFQPFLVLLIGWILGWDVNRIVGVVSVLNFVTVFASFFRALKLSESNGKGHGASPQM